MIQRNLLLFLLCMLTSLTVLAQVPHTFSSGQSASAAEVNANFAALVSQINQLQTQVQALQAINTPSVANIAGTYRLLEVSVDVDNNGESVGIAGEHNSGVVTLNANGTGVFTGNYTYRQVSLFQYPVNVRNAGGTNDIQLEQTDYQLNTDGGADNSEFTWALNGKVVTVTIPPEDEFDTEHTMTFYAANSLVLVSGDDDEGQASLSVLVRQ